MPQIPVNIEQAAAALRSARETRQAIAPISSQYGITTLEDAYAVAGVNTRLNLAAGQRLVGKKVGLTSVVVQKQLGVDQPDFGMLFDVMEVLNREEVRTETLLQPRVEAEVAFVMGTDLNGCIPSWAEFLRAVAYALPALEIVDSAIADWKINLFDTVADNASCGLYVLGDQPVALGSISLGDIAMEMSCNGRAVSSGTGAACLGHPLRAAYWLARTMAARGEPLKAGEVILSGALGPMFSVAKGQHIRADLGALGSVACYFN